LRSRVGYDKTVGEEQVGEAQKESRMAEDDPRTKVIDRRACRCEPKGWVDAKRQPRESCDDKKRKGHATQLPFVTP